MLELKTKNPKAHEWLNKIPVEHWAISHFSGKAKSDLFLNNICEVFNGVIDKCIGPLTPTVTRIMESIKKEAHLIKVQWNGANKYQVSGLLGNQCVVDVVSMTCSCRKWELTGIPCKHVVAACWNMALNDRVTPPLETWVNPCYWLSIWKETYSYKIQPIYGTNYWEKSTCPTTLLPPKHHIQVGRPKKKRKRSKHKDEPFVKDGKPSRKGRTITCQSCGNIGHNKATCKGQGRKATIGSGSASRQAQQTEPVVGQDGSSGSGAGVVIGLSTAVGEGGAGDPCGAGVVSQGSSHTRWTRRRV
ncbi:crooked neck-like protein 1 [Tanacetum coccineum]